MRQGTILLKFAKTTPDPKVAAGLIEKAADLKLRVDEQGDAPDCFTVRSSHNHSGIALKCRSCSTPRYSPPVHMIRLTETQELAPPLGASRRLIPASPAPSRQNKRQRRINCKRIEQSAALFVADEHA